ncbi:MAG: DUF4136 domain-containing protein [Steroidobacter sp.]
MNTRFLIAVCLSVTALAGCAATTSNVRIDKADVDLSKCETFDWLPASGDAASFTEQRVRAAAMQQLEQKGYGQSVDKPDCRITYVLDTHEQPGRKPRVGVGAGGGSRGVGGGIGVSIPIGQKDQHVGEFTLDVIDVGSNAQIWSGSIDAAFRAAELTEDEAQGVVRRILAEYPDRATGE